MEEKETVVENIEEEIQTTFNEDSLEELNDREDCTIENVEEVVEDGNKNE